MKIYLKVWLMGGAFALAALALMILASQPTRAAGPWYVKAFGGSDGNSCLSPSAACATINGAIAKASPDDTIYVTGETYTGTGDEVVLLDKNVTLSGGWNGDFTGQDWVSIVDGQGGRRGLTVQSGVTALVEHFVFQYGSDAGLALPGGGGILNQGLLTLNISAVVSNTINGSGGGIRNYSGGSLMLNSSVISNNMASAGGGLANEGAATFHNSLISGNRATVQSGGGIVNLSGQLILNNSAVSGNTTSGKPQEGADGGGISGGDVGGSVILNNSTLSGNTAAGRGGAIFNYGHTVILNNSTLSHNTAAETGGIYNNAGSVISASVTLQNSILAANMGGDSPDCVLIDTAGYNLIGDTAGCNFAPTGGDLTDIDPGLGPLEGLLSYHPLLLSSPAINAGNPAGCTDHLGQPLATDQRGVPRLGRCDIGAYEYVTRTFLPAIFGNFSPPTYSDDFSDPASGWDVIDDGMVQSEYIDGEYRILSKQAGYFYFFRAPTYQGQNYVVETDARWAAGLVGHSYGLIFGIIDNGSNFFHRYYLFDINPNAGRFRLLRRDPNGFTTIAPSTSTAAINGGTASNHLKATRNGDQITLEVNGTILGVWSDKTITGLTDVGLVSNPDSNNPISDARFDNFAVTDLPGSGAAAQGLNKAMVGGDRLPISGVERVPLPVVGEWSPGSK